MTTDILGGHSGGPVVDAAGDVIGVAVQSLFDAVGGGKVLTTDADGREVLVDGRECNGGLHAVRPIHEARPMLRGVEPGPLFVTLRNAFMARGLARPADDLLWLIYLHSLP